MDGVHWGLVLWYLVFPANLGICFEVQAGESTESRPHASLRRMLRHLTTFIHAGVAGAVAAIILLLAGPLGTGTQAEDIYAVFQTIGFWLIFPISTFVAVIVLGHRMAVSNTRNSAIWLLRALMFASVAAFVFAGTWLAVGIVLRVLYPLNHALVVATERGIVTMGVLTYFTLQAALGCTGLVHIASEAIVAEKKV